MNNNLKLNFRLVPAAGVATGRGYRAEFVRKAEDVIDIDSVIAEAQQKGAFSGMPANLVRGNLETLFDTLIGNVLADGKTRKLDNYLEVSLNLRGIFENATDDYDPEKQSLKLSVKHLSAFRRQPNGIQPVNVNRIRQFRVTTLTAADGQHANHEVVFGQDFVIRGSNLTPECKASGISCQVLMPDGIYHGANPPVVSRSDCEIRCSWPEEYTSETIRRQLIVCITKVPNLETDPSDINRVINASILPA